MISRTYDQPRSGRFLGWALVALFHAVLIYALVHSLAHRTVPLVQKPLQVKIIEQTPTTPPPPPPPPPPTLAPPPPPYIPPPEIHIATPPPPQPAAITAITSVKPPPQPVITPTAPPAVQVEPQINVRLSRQPPYPPEARRRHQEGIVLMQVLVDVDGKVIDSKLMQSSGVPLLDQEALDGVKQYYRFTPGTVGGKPKQMWHEIRFVWQLR